MLFIGVKTKTLTLQHFMNNIDTLLVELKGFELYLCIHSRKNGFG